MRVSVIIPVRDGEAFLGQTIRSALNQSLPPAEVLVVDNGSTDRTVEIAASFGKPVQVLHEPAAGACSARNTGAAAATGEALMFLDADDLIGPTVLEELANVLAAWPGSVACCPWRRYELANGCWRVRPASCKPRRRGQDPLSAWLTGWYHPPCSVLWSAEAYRRSGGWDPAIRMDQDGDIMMRALAAGVPLELTAGGTAYYRRLPDGAISLSGRRLTPEGLRSRLEVIEGVERTLTEHGSASRFRLPLRAAFQNIRTDAAGQVPDVARRADAGARRNKPRILDFIVDCPARRAGCSGPGAAIEPSFRPLPGQALRETCPPRRAGSRW